VKTRQTAAGHPFIRSPGRLSVDSIHSIVHPFTHPPTRRFALQLFIDPSIH
jgi:hypothetical protein